MIDNAQPRVRSTAMLVTMMVAEVAAALTLAITRSAIFPIVFLTAAIFAVCIWDHFRRARLEVYQRALLAETGRLMAIGDHVGARQAAERSIASASSPTALERGLTALAWSYLLDGNPRAAKVILEEIQPPSAVDSYTLAAVERALGDSARAIQLLRNALQNGSLSREAARLFIDLQAEVGDFEGAAATTVAVATLLTEEDLHTIVRALEEVYPPIKTVVAGHTGGGHSASISAFIAEAGSLEMPLVSRRDNDAEIRREGQQRTVASRIEKRPAA
jgi:hypothetical protein